MIVRTKLCIRYLWLSLAICNLTGCTTWTTVPNDPESVRYIDSVVAEVLVPGTPITYRNEATPELQRNFPAKQFAQASVRIQVTVGQPIGPTHTSGSTQVVVGSSDGVTKIAQYSTLTELQRGIAVIEIRAMKRNNKWELGGIVIHIHPPAHR
jgi:hypothetical protein